MYRQIILNPNHNEPIRNYKLQAVTFDFNCALHRLYKDILDTHQITSPNLKNEMNADNVLPDVHTTRGAEIDQERLITDLESAGFPLRKWTSNTRKLLDNISENLLLNATLLTLPESENHESLGIRWKNKRIYYNAIAENLQSCGKN